MFETANHIALILGGTGGGGGSIADAETHGHDPNKINPTVEHSKNEPKSALGVCNTNADCEEDCFES